MNNEKKQQYIKRMEIVLNLFIAEKQEDLFMEVPVSRVARWFAVKQRDIRNLSIIAHNLSPLRIITEMIEKIEENGEMQSPYMSGATLAMVEEYGNMFVQLLMMSNPEVAIKRIFKVVGAKEDEVKSVLKNLFGEYAKRFVLRLHAIIHEFSYPFEMYDAVWLKGTVTEKQFKGMVRRYGVE